MELSEPATKPAPLTNWSTPIELFEWFNEIHDFKVDAAADESNHLTPKWYGPGSSDVDALTVPLWASPAWCNPPYGRGLENWIDKFIEQQRLGVRVVALLPNFTESGWFWKAQRTAGLIFLKGRVPFIDPTSQARTQPRYGSVIFTFEANDTEGDFTSVEWWDWREDVGKQFDSVEQTT